MNDVLLRVRPGPIGWVVDSGGRLEMLRFLAGARAEAQAHRLALALAQSGDDARVEVHDRGGRMVGARRYFADETA